LWYSFTNIHKDKLEVVLRRKKINPKTNNSLVPRSGTEGFRGIKNHPHRHSTPRRRLSDQILDKNDNHPNLKRNRAFLGRRERLTQRRSILEKQLIKTESSPHFEFTLQPGNATPEDICNFLLELNKLYVLLGGSELKFSTNDEFKKILAKATV
jgi:hypothetical protein